MKGIVTPALVWVLAVAPALLAVSRVPRWAFIAFGAGIGAAGLGAWLAVAGLGYRITENQTTSFDGHLYLHRAGEPFARGDLVAFRWGGGATYPRGTIFIKQVVGVPGDVVRRDGADFWVNDQYIGAAKPVSRAGVPLEPASAGVIREGEYFVATPSPDSLDSRYALTGNISAKQIVGRAYEIF